MNEGAETRSLPAGGALGALALIAVAVARSGLASAPRNGLVLALAFAQAAIVLRWLMPLRREAPWLRWLLVAVVVLALLLLFVPFWTGATAPSYRVALE